MFELREEGGSSTSPAQTFERKTRKKESREGAKLSVVIPHQVDGQKERREAGVKEPEGKEERGFAEKEKIDALPHLILKKEPSGRRRNVGETKRTRKKKACTYASQRVGKAMRGRKRRPSRRGRSDS